MRLHAQQVLGYSAFEFGLGTAVFAVMAAAGSIKGNAMVQRLGARAVAAAGMALMGSGALLVTQASVGGSYFGDLFLALVAFGAGPRHHLRHRHSRRPRRHRPERVRTRVRPQQHRPPDRRRPRGRHPTTVALARSEDFGAANTGADPLVVLNEGLHAAFLACAVFAALGMALAVLLPGRPRVSTHERLERPGRRD